MGVEGGGELQRGPGPCSLNSSSPPGSPREMSQDPRVPWSTVWEALGGVLRGLWETGRRERCGGGGLGCGTGVPGRRGSGAHRRLGAEEGGVSESPFLRDQLCFLCRFGGSPRSGGLSPRSGQSCSVWVCVFQSQGSSLVSLCQPFSGQPPRTPDSHWAQPFLYATPQKARSLICPLGGPSPALLVSA